MAETQENQTVGVPGGDHIRLGGENPTHFRNHKGHLIPASHVKGADLLQDQLVRRIMDRAQSLSGLLRAFKVDVFSDVGAFLAILTDQYGAQRGGKKGNMTFTTFDGTMKIQVAVADYLVFGPELQIAKALIDECIGDWAADANANIRLLVDHAFRTDKEGQVSRESIFALRHIAIDDPRWARAMEAIADSIRIAGSKTYVRFYVRENPESPWRSITLDLANA